MSALVLIASATAASLIAPASDAILGPVAAAHLIELDRCGAVAVGEISARVGVIGGEVVAVALTDSSLPADQQRCALASLFSWRFPAQTTADFSLTLALSPPLPPMSDADVAAVGRVVRAGSGQLRRCYEQALNTNPTLSVSTHATLAIVDGSVSAIQLSEGIDEPLQTCVDRRLRSWRFPAGVSGEVVLPLSFTPSVSG
ncbi:MAG: hypothetical protein ACI8RZ_004574 [Myxococcota bacterium]|jgi:hypothetical protein